MVNIDYSKGYAEVLEIINAMPKKDYNRIPSKYIEYLEENADRSVNFQYNIAVPFDKQEISDEAKDVLAVIYRLFLADEENKKKLSEIDRELVQNFKEINANKVKFEEQAKYKQLTKTAIMVVKKQSLIKRIFNKVKKWFGF